MLAAGWGRERRWVGSRREAGATRRRRRRRLGRREKTFGRRREVVVCFYRCRCVLCLFDALYSSPPLGRFCSLRMGIMKSVYVAWKRGGGGETMSLC